MLLTPKQFLQHGEHKAGLCDRHTVSIDFETTGLKAYKGDTAFLMGFTDIDGKNYSVKFRGWTPDEELTVLRGMQLFFSNPRLTYASHNSKFESSFLDQQFGITIAGDTWDTLVMARLERNSHMSYALDACAQRIGEEKYKPAAEWLKLRGNKNAYHLMPDEIIIPYCEHDAWLSWRLKQHQTEVFRSYDTSSNLRPIYPVVKLEKQVLPHLFEMEKHGLLVDVGYCMRAIEYEKQCIEEAKRAFEREGHVAFVDSRKTLQPVFDAAGICYGQTALGNASFTEDSFVGSKGNPLVAAVLAHRRATKRLSAYWENFLELEHNGIIHPSINQNKAQTGRMSISDPSCQNWSTDEDEATQFPIRRAFIARPGCLIASLDYSQMELRKGADESEDLNLIERIQSGADLHQEVADIAGVPRSLAKNGRFAKQYGAGIPKIAQTLGITEELARTISEAIDQQCAKMTAYSRMLSRQAKSTFVTDWLGRRFYFDRGFDYKAFNYVIQGGCAEILKIAIRDVGEFLKTHASEETFMLVPIHDEIVLNIHESDLHLLPEIKRIMIAAQGTSRKHLDMDVGIEVGPNFHDLEKYNA